MPMPAQHTPAPLSPTTVELVSRFGHDFNNLLGIILGGLSLLRDDLPAGALDEGLAEILEDVLSAAQEAGVVIEQLTAATGRSLCNIRHVDLNDSARQAGESLRHALPESVRIRIETNREPTPVAADPEHIAACCRELAANAVRAMGGRGEIVIACRATPGPTLELRDDGPGMAPDLLGRCTEPYVTTWKHDGHRGLGLAAVAGTLRSGGVQLVVRSEPGAGTRVTLSFPQPEDTPIRAPIPLK